ncbi:methionine--tRNA ligase subunit beta, partial [Paramuribaculum intestinale]
NDTDRAMMEEIRQTRRRLDEALDTFHFREALKEAMEIARIGNRYLQETEPWKTAKTDEQRTATVLNLALQICANLAVAFEPFLPFASASIASMLRLDRLSWDMIGTFDLVPAGIEIATPQLLFEKIDDSVIAAQLKKLDDIKRANQLKGFKAEPQAPDVDFDTFMKADIRVGTVKECVKVPKADKLLRFTIDDGLGGRTIVSGIAKHYAPEDLVGKQVCFIANLPPRKLKGIESQGMILSAENADGSLVVIGPTGPVVAGAQVK